MTGSREVTPNSSVLTAPHAYLHGGSCDCSWHPAPRAARSFPGTAASAARGRFKPDGGPSVSVDRRTVDRRAGCPTAARPPGTPTPDRADRAPGPDVRMHIELTDCTMENCALQGNRAASPVESPRACIGRARHATPAFSARQITEVVILQDLFTLDMAAAQGAASRA